MNRMCKICICLFLFVGLFTGCAKPVQKTGHIRTPAGQAVSVGEDGTGIQARFGTPEDYAEAQSCYGKGYDKVYTYPGFEITTYPAQNGRSEFISILVLTDDTAQTGLGLKVGMTRVQMTDLYGGDFVQRGQSCVYTLEKDVTLWVDIEDDTITRIEFRAP